MALWSDAYPYVVFLHVFGVFLFLLGHGASASIAFRMKRETDRTRIAALLDTSAASYKVLMVSFFWILISGAVLGAIAGWWRMAWFWAAIAILFVISGAMTPLVAIPYNKARKVLGLKPPFESKKAASKPPPTETVEELLKSARPELAAGFGIGGIAVLLWLMMFKPF